MFRADHGPVVMMVALTIPMPLAVVIVVAIAVPIREGKRFDYDAAITVALAIVIAAAREWDFDPSVLSKIPRQLNPIAVANIRLNVVVVLIAVNLSLQHLAQVGTLATSKLRFLRWLLMLDLLDVRSEVTRRVAAVVILVTVAVAELGTASFGTP